MTTQSDSLKALIQSCNPDTLTAFFRAASPHFKPATPSIPDPRTDRETFGVPVCIGSIDFDDMQQLLVVFTPVTRELTSRTGKGKQYDLAKAILKQTAFSAGIFCFADPDGVFRFSFVAVDYLGTKKAYTSFRRYTYFVDPHTQTNRTFLDQIGTKAKFTDLNTIRAAFSIEAVSEDFYKEFSPQFQMLADHVQGTSDAAKRQDFALLFIIRIIFLGFVQKKGWLGDDPAFLDHFQKAYARCQQKDQFYTDWLAPLFFEALNSAPGQKVAYGANAYPPKIEEALQMAPYLNGELFKRKPGMDDQSLWIPDQAITDFFEFLFTYNFTIEEAKLDDADLGLNPEFLGIIFERLVNKADGAVYTPRTEVDFMCRMALLQWLHKRLPEIDLAQLYGFFFRSGSTEETQVTGGVFSSEQLGALIDALETVTICDPAAGSGAFEVGMLQVLEEALEDLYARPNLPADRRWAAPNRFERKKDIISRSLYGVEVKAWAVWINQLRLWLTLFIDMDDDMRTSQKPLLPNLQFKVRQGDSLIQLLGGKLFPVRDLKKEFDVIFASLTATKKQKDTIEDLLKSLKESKIAFFQNKNVTATKIQHLENELFLAFLDLKIEGLKAQLLKLDKPPARQTSLIPEENPKQLDLDLSSIERQRIQSEIETLAAQFDCLQENLPFTWNIEFAEIFSRPNSGFDIIIGNPPYVRQEAIGDPAGGMSATAYKALLMQLPLLDYPDYFGKSASESDKYRGSRKTKRESGQDGLPMTADLGSRSISTSRPDGRSDLYTYFYLHSLRLLNPGGVHVFICSNSWLDVGYGAWLQEFFLSRAPLRFVFDNHARRSFASADVNTIITVADAPGSKAVPVGHKVRFVAFKQPFEEVLTGEVLLGLEETESAMRNEQVRCYPLSVGDLREAGKDPEKGTYEGDKWGGKYLRAPDIYFTILEKGKGKLVRLGDVAEVRRGITTGANDFFYLTPLGPGSKPGLMRVRNGAGWEGEIEEEFLKPVIKSPRECRTIRIKAEDLRFRIFMCHKSKAELKGTNALAYIEWGEKARPIVKAGEHEGGSVSGFDKISSVLSRPRWYDVGLRRVPPIIVPCSFRSVFNIFFNSSDVFADKRLYEVFPKGDPTNLVIQLNSTIFPLFLELMTRNIGGGGGPIDATVEEITKILVLETCLTNDARIGNIERVSIFVECGFDPKSDTPISQQEPHPLPDRKALDDVVFDALGLTADERKEVYRAVCTLVWERISKAESV